MYCPNFCAECGERLARGDWRAWVKAWTGAGIAASWCDDCARRLGRRSFARPIAIISIIAISAFILGRYLRPAPPPLIISRVANSPLSDLPVNFNDATRPTNRKEDSTGQDVAGADREDAAYICGARTKKGTPCRRRVHVAGERCFQHKGMPAILPLEKLEVRNK